MDESEDNLNPEDIKSTDSPLTVKNKPKKRSLIERELETNLTSRITSPAIINDGTSTSRYGRARRLKSKLEQSDMKQVTADLKSPLMERSPIRTLSQSPVYKMHASNSPLKRTESPKKMIEQFLDNQIETIYQENISLSRFGNEEVSAAAISPAKKFPKVYIRKDLIQKREPEDTVTVIQNMFSPTKSAKKSSSTHLNNILERSSERYSLNNKSQNGYTGNSSVVKTLDFDSKKKKKDIKDTKVLPSKSELFDLEARCPYQVGDLAWARMGTYPFWPSIVTRDPSTGIFVKKKLYGRIERDVIHVTFFGDNGRRSWIVDNMLRKYVGQLEFEAARENFTPEAKKKDPKLYAAYFISEKKLPLWNNSVEEAEMLLREPKRLRIDLFNDMLAKSRYNKAKQPKSKISRTDSDVSLSESLYDSLFSEEDGKSDVDGSRNRSRKKSFDMFEVVTACLDNMAAKTGITKIQRQSHMDRWLQKAKSKTPEKAQTKTQLTTQIHKEDKKEATLKVSKKKKSSTPKRKSYPVRKSYSLRKSNESHRLVANQMEVDNEDTGTNYTFSDHEGSKEGNEICIIAKVESLAQKTQDKIVETVLSNETCHSESVKDSSTCESETYTEEYSNFNNDANNSIINEDKSVISTPNSESVSKSFISENSISIEQDSSKVDFQFERDRNENQDRVNSETSNAEFSSEVGHSIESGIDEKEFYSGLESKSDDIEKQNSTNTITSNEDHSPEVEFNSKKRDSIELRRSSRRNVYSETKNIIAKQDSVAMRNDIDEKELKSGLESQSDNMEIQNIINMETTNENNTQEVDKADCRSSRGSIDSEAYNILAKQDSAVVRSSIDEKELDSGLESKSNNIKIQNSTNMETRNEDHSSQVEFNCNKRDSVKLRRSSRRNVSSERSNILANQDSSGIEEKEFRSGLKSQSDNIEIQNSTNIETLNYDYSPKVEFNSKTRDDVDLKRISRDNVISETNNIIAKQDNAAMRTGMEGKELYCGLESDNIELENSTHTETPNKDYNAKVELNSKKRDGVELRKSSRGNIQPETNSIIAKQDSAAIRTSLDEPEFYGGLDSKSDNIKTQDSMNTKTSNEEKVEINPKKTKSVELRRSSRRNVNSETNNIIAKQDGAAMTLHRPAQVSQTNNTIQNNTLDNIPAKSDESIAVTNTNIEDIQYQNETVDKYETSNVTKEDKGGITLTTQDNIETFYNHSSNINKDVDNIEENEPENMSIDDDSDSEHLPYSPLSNLGNNSDDNLSLSEAPFVDDNVTELEKQNIDITNEDNMDNISTKVDEEINVRQELSYDYCDKQNADYNLIARDAEKSKSKIVNNSMCDKIVENGYIHENDVQNIPQNEDNITEINVLEHKVVLNNNTKDDGKQDSINNINNGYRGENVREIEMASKEVRIYVSDSSNKNSKTIKENGFHDINEDFDTTSIHSEDSVTSTKSASRHRLRSNQDKKLEDPLLNPEFVKYVELRQDALTEENPDLNEQEIVAYLYKTWLYEESMKSDVKKNDDLRDINLVKGLNPPQSEAPARTKRNLSLNKKEVPKINTLQRYLRRKKDGVDKMENEEIGLCRKRGMRKNMIKDDDDAVSVKEDFVLPNIVKNNVDVSVFNLVKDKPKIPTEDVLKTSVDTTIPDRGQEIGGQGPLELSPLSSNNVNEISSLVEQVTSDSNTQTKFKDDFDRESIDSEDSETPLIRCKLRSKAKKENSIDVKIKEEDADTVSINSEDSEISITKRKKKFNGKKIETTMEDPEFLKYLELRQDALIDEHPELTQDEIVTYLYQTWLYEENNKSETKKNDEIQQSTLVKGLNDSVPELKKYKRKVPRTERAEKDSVDEDIPGKEKPKRKSVKPFYNEEYSDIEEELEVFEIFKPKIHKLSAEQAVNSEINPSVSTSELVQEGVEVYDEVELYFAELTKPKPNVFKGLIREKVCEICEKCNNLIKCKGCNGMFHINCVKKETEVVETPVPIRGRKKKKRGRKCKNSEEFDNDDSQDTIPEDNTSIEEILETDSHAVDADVLEAQLSAKMKEILDSAEIIDYDSYSSDDCLDWNESVPGKCQIVDVKLKPKRSTFEIENFKCNNCQQYDTPVCFVCKNAVSKQETTKRQKCHFAHCHKYYHLECLDIWPQTQFNGGEPSKNNKKINEYFEALTCPRHVCHTCVSDDPRGCKTRFSGDKLARCVRCPATYHSFTKCLPAGTQILTASHIICPRHYEHRPPGKVPCHVNTGWCFICALGGSLICCEYCPTSFHAECLNIDPPEGGYMCEDCETGRLPLYGEMVWVKLGHYRWWPGIILHPYEIPENLFAVKHSLGEFVVRFFGQYDHYWVNRGRVFPFQEGDSGRVSGQKSKIDAAFTTAMEHAQRACEILKKAVPNEEESMDIASSLLPPHYVKLKVNKPCGSLCGRRLEDPESSLTQCECNPNDEDPCGPYSQCLNRMLLTECGPTCRAGDRCNNRAFEKRLYPKLVPYRTPSRGWGLKTLEDIKAGQFVIEYVGELIDEEEFRRRMRRKHEIRDENFYFLTLDKERMIDAGPKGNLARFMNHCCEPNCETQKWTVLGDVRVGLFALYDIPANSEVTFNYNLECAGIDKKRCMCGAKRCSGYIGAKPKQEESQSKKNKLHPVKRTYKKRKPEESPSTKNKPKRPIGRPPKPKELTEIEKDLLIIRNATNCLSSDESSKSLSSELDKNPKALKRKRVNFSTEEIVVYDGTESPSVKKSKIDDKLEGD